MMAAEKAAPLPLSAVFSSVDEKQYAHADLPFVLGVRHVIIWAFLHAACAAFAIAYIFIVTFMVGRPPSWLLPRNVEVTHNDVVAALVPVMIWCGLVVSQAAAGALALALPRHRLFLAYMALLATAGGHLIWAGVHIFVAAADPGGLLSVWTGDLAALVIISGVGDFLCFRGLLRDGGILRICLDVM